MKSKRGGKREGAGRPLKFGEELKGSYIKFPISYYKKLRAAAEAEKMPLNAYIMRKILFK